MNLAQDLRAPYLISMGFKLMTDNSADGACYQRLEKERMQVLLQGIDGVRVTCVSEHPQGGAEWTVKFSSQAPVAAVLMVLLLAPMHQITKFDGIV